MKLRILFAGLAAALVVLWGCGSAKGILADANWEALLGMHRDEVHQNLGEPVGALSGFDGEIFDVLGELELIVYYDSEGYVEAVSGEGISVGIIAKVDG